VEAAYTTEVAACEYETELKFPDVLFWSRRENFYGIYDFTPGKSVRVCGQVLHILELNTFKVTADGWKFK